MAVGKKPVQERGTEALTRSKPMHILVVEDNPAHANVLAFNLRKAGYCVATVAEAVGAVRLAVREHFDLIIVDYYLPDYLGTDFVKILRMIHSYSHTPVILLTARAEELNQKRVRDELLVLLMSKPCSMADLLATVSKCLALAHSTS